MMTKPVGIDNEGSMKLLIFSKLYINSHEPVSCSNEMSTLSPFLIHEDVQTQKFG